MTDSLSYPDYCKQGLLSAVDYSAELSAQADAQSAYNLSQRSWGLVRGFTVELLPDLAGASISSGVALDSLGRALVLEKEETLSVSDFFSSKAYIAISLQETFTDWKAYTKASGNSRIKSNICFQLLSKPPQDSGKSIILASLSIGTDQRISAIDFTDRNISNISLGHLAFPRPDLPAGNGVTIKPNAENALVINSPRTDYFGSVRIDGQLKIGPVDSTQSARLAIRSPLRITASTKVSNDDNLLYSDTVGGLSNLSVGDQIYIEKPENEQPPEFNTHPPDTYASVTVIQAESPDSILSDPAPDQNFVDVGYQYSQATILRALDGRGRIAMTVKSNGRVGIGTDNPNEALSITGGDLGIAKKQNITFSGDGQIESIDKSRNIHWSTTSKTLAINSIDDIALFTSSAVSHSDPTMIITRQGKVGLGVTNPAYSLSVDGIIRTSKGLVFPDGSVQVKGVVSIPIGTIIDWWRAPGSAEFAIDGFQICDGSAITDPKSPLNGKATPNLSGQLIMGVVNFQQIGETGGAATHTHGFTAAAHTHTMDHSHQVEGTTQATSSEAGDDIAGSTVAHLGHVHTFTLQSSPPTPSITGQNMKALTGNTGPGSTLPKHMFALKVMRIK